MTDLITLKPTFIDRGGAQVYDVIEDAERPLSSINRGQTRLAPDPRIKELEEWVIARSNELGRQIVKRDKQIEDAKNVTTYCRTDGNIPLTPDPDGGLCFITDVLAALGEQE
jgi:hypothetical protein